MFLGIFHADPYLPVDYWRRLAPSTTRTEIEIGPGDCGFLADAAAAAAGTLFVGMEIKRASVVLAGRKRRFASNAIVFNTDGRWLVENMVADASVNAYHVYFPDPWWKKRHHKRRLFTPEFCAGLFRTLTPGGSVYLISDVARVVVDARPEMTAAGFTEREWTRGQSPAACSSYERKYRVQGRRLSETSFVKN